MTLAEAQANLAAAKSAYTSALDAASYAIGTGGSTRTVTRQSLELLKKEMMYWEERVAQLDGSRRTGLRTRFITP